MTNNQIERRRAFTLIELLVVISIIALLLSILMPGLKRAKDLAKRTICATRLRQVGTAMVNYSLDYDDKLPDSLDQNGKPEFGHGYVVYREEIVDTSGKPIPLRWAKLYEGGYMDTPEIFYCPANRDDIRKYESYTAPAPWGTLPQQFNETEGNNQWVRIGYTYFPIPRTNPKWSSNDRLELAGKFTQLNPSLPYATDIIQGRSNLSHQRRQSDEDTFEESNNYLVNVLYSDTHVATCKDPEVFRNDIWDQWYARTVTYDRYYWTVFKSIGSK